MPNARVIQFPKIEDARGNLTFVESHRQIPFDIRRVYYLYDVPGGATRAGHGHRHLEQVLIAISGSFDVEVDDGSHKETFHLNRPHLGLFLPSLTWRDINNFSSGAVCLVIASEFYDESDYFRSYEQFLKAAGK